MSENNIGETEKEKYCKNNIPKEKVVVKMNKVHSKKLSVLKIIILIFLLIILISGLFIFTAYLFLSKKSKESKKSENDPSIIKAQLDQESKINLINMTIKNNSTPLLNTQEQTILPKIPIIQKKKVVIMKEKCY
jgi:flagellar basal body-associated protein FliL